RRGVDSPVDRPTASVRLNPCVSRRGDGHRCLHRRCPPGRVVQACLAEERLLIAPLRRFVWSAWGPIAERAARAYVAGPELADALRVCRALAGRGDAATICWCRSLSDVDQAVALGVRVRVVKGQWPDPAGSDPDVQRNFLAIVESLAGRASRVGVATHDPQLARAALAHLCATGTACELELLYGLPARTPLEIARAAGVPVRFYVPYGHAWLPYGLSQVRRHPRVLWWTMRDWLSGWRQTAHP